MILFLTLALITTLIAQVESGILINVPKQKIPAEVFVLDPKVCQYLFVETQAVKPSHYSFAHQAARCYDFVSVVLKQVVNKLMLDSNRQKLMADLYDCASTCVSCQHTYLLSSGPRWR
jgi:hypothetical protein